jgi:hypothetical protein
MAGSLVLLDSVSASSSSTVSLGASNWNTGFNVYKVIITDVTPSTDSSNLRMRVLKSGTAQTDSNYDRAYKQLRTDTSFQIVATEGGDHWKTTNNSNGTNTGETAQGVFYLFNFNGSEYSFVTNETSNLTADPILIAVMGAGIHKVASASNGLQFYYTSGNIASGTFKLYGIVK